MAAKRKPAGIDMEQNYVTVTLCIVGLELRTPLMAKEVSFYHICLFFYHSRFLSGRVCALTIKALGGFCCPPFIKIV